MKKLSLLSLGLMSFSALVLGAAPVFAADVTAKTEGTVLFEVDDETEPPTTPPTTVEPGGENPGGTVDPEKPGTDGEKGDGDPSFNITHVSNFRFNDKERDANGVAQLVDGKFVWKPIKLNSNGMTLYAYGTDLTLNRQNSQGKWIDAAGEEVDEANAQKLTYSDIPNFVEVTDNRGNKDAGWKLMVSRTEFTSDKGELTGSALSLNDSFIAGPAGVTAPVFSENEVEIPVGDGASTGVEVMSAAKGTGTGTWSLSFGTQGETAVVKQTEDEVPPVSYKKLALTNGEPDSGVKLVVPAAAQAQTDALYTSNITWTLASVPAE